MPAVGGSIESITIDGRYFAVPADNDPGRELGGSSNEVMPNGDGSARLKKTKKNWSISDIQTEIDDTAGDHEFLQDNADKKDWSVITISLASGAVYQGQGSIVGDLPASGQDAVASFGLAGPGKLTKQ